MTELIHQLCHAVAGKTDASGINHLPVARCIRRFQILSKPPAKRNNVSIRTPVRGRAPHAEDAVSIFAFFTGEFLVIEQPSLVIGCLEDGRAVSRGGFNKLGNVLGETDKWIFDQQCGSDANGCQDEFAGTEKACNDNDREYYVLEIHIKPGYWLMRGITDLFLHIGIGQNLALQD